MIYVLLLHSVYINLFKISLQPIFIPPDFPNQGLVLKIPPPSLPLGQVSEVFILFITVN